MEDQYHGVGGSYVRDPSSGERRQVEAPTRSHPEGDRARDAAEDAPAAPSPALQPEAQQVHEPKQDTPAEAIADPTTEAAAPSAPARIRKGGNPS